jgi:hypothetical protein
LFGALPPLFGGGSENLNAFLPGFDLAVGAFLIGFVGA